MFTSRKQDVDFHAQCIMGTRRADLGAVPKMVAGLYDVCNRPRLHNYFECVFLNIVS